MPPINPVYFTGSSGTSFNTAVPQGVARVETPFQELNRNALVVTQRYMQKRSAYVQPAQNSTMPASVAANITFSGTAYFVGDGPREPVGIDDVITFERTWATKPSQIIDTANPIKVTVTKPNQWTMRVSTTWQQYTYGWSSFDRIQNRGLLISSQTLSLTAYIQRDFFLIGSGGDYANISLIPARNEDVRVYKDWSSFPINQEMPSETWNNLVSALPTQTAKILSGFQSMVQYSAILTVSRAAGGGSASTNYQDYTGSGLAAGTYIYGDSELTRYIGNIWERRSVNVTIT